MNYANFYRESTQRLVDALVSTWASGHPTEQHYLRKMLINEPLVARPVFQTIFPWKQSELNFLEHATRLRLFDEDFVTGLSSISDEKSREYAFPADRCPYTHQTESWKAMLQDRKTIVVTSGTGSGKTECFMIPVLQDLFRSRCRGEEDGIQAIFLYPLNALMKNQQRRIDAWCRSLSPKVTYAIYNSEMDETGRTDGKYPQIFTRTDLRKNPPQILFTNPTMLNYMMVRTEDQQILEKSRGKLRWILLDEAHTYTGSSATELSLQIRQVIDAFGVTIDQVNFAVTSATIGDPDDPEVGTRLKNTISQLTGKPAKDIKIISGTRVIPELDKDRLRGQLSDICEEFGGSISVQEVEHLRTLLNTKPALEASAIAGHFNKNLSVERQLELIDRLSTKVKGLGINGEDQAILPARGHFFIRSINGVYACPNPKCPSSKGDSFDLGSLTTYQNVNCPHCGSHLLEVASCPDCGKLVLVGENDTERGYRMKVTEHSLDEQLFEPVEDEDETDEETSTPSFYSYFVIGKNDQPCPRSSAMPHYVVLNAAENRLSHLEHLEDATEEDNVYREVNDRDTNAALCPHCGAGIKGNLVFLRSSATFMGRILATEILDNAEPMDARQDRDILYEGRKFIAFTDSRQGTAKSAMTTNQEVERNWIRTEIFHKLAEKRLSNYHPGGGLSQEEQGQYDFLIASDGHLPKVLQKQLDDLKSKLEGNHVPDAEMVPWSEIQRGLEANPSLKHLYHHLKEAKKNAIINWADGSSSSDLGDYLNSLYFDQFSWIPKRSNSLETMGMVHMVYPPLSRAVVPEELGRHGFSDEDWRNYLKVCVDYVVRSKMHIIIPESVKSYLVQTSFVQPIYGPDSERVKGQVKWPVLKGGPNTVDEKQSRIVLILCAALGIDNKDSITQDQRILINTMLRRAWEFIRDNVLTLVDTTRKDYGYQLDILSPDKVRLQLMTEGWVCPVDHVVIDTLVKGYSPRIHGYLNAMNLERFKVKTDRMIYPFYPYANNINPKNTNVHVTRDEVHRWMEENLGAQRESGQLDQLITQIYEKRSIYLAGEHSAQQQRNILEQYEDDFNKGHMNILSCSTTMEMGVDLKGITAVVMNTVPPKPANYLQRAGRAGRRGESKAMALTFCSPTPIGMNAWRHPLWPMEHKTETPQIKFESRQIVQRHVNSFLFAFFIRTQGGIKVKASICDFFDGDKRYADLFHVMLQRIVSGEEALTQDLSKRYRGLTKGTCMDTITVEQAATACVSDLERVRKIYKNRLEAINLSMERAEELGGKVLSAVTRRKNAYLNSPLLPYLAENNFIPSAGIPTGLVEFVPNLMENSGNRKMPTQHLSQAISNYAPGHQIVLNEWCYEAQGIEMKSKFVDSKKDVLQCCSACGYAVISMGDPIKVCPKCGKQTMVGVKGLTHGTQSSNFTEIVEPAGFTVEWGYRPNRRLRMKSTMDFIQPLLLRMDPWSDRPSNIKIMMRTSQPESEILFYNTGNSGKGFALCPYCGRMKSETTIAGDDHDVNPLELHKHLETGGQCEGAEHGGSHIRRNVLLIGRYQTDFVEIKFFNQLDQEIQDAETLYSLGVILSRKLTEVLGVNEGEIDFGYNPEYHSIFIYDTALGGAGYSPLLREYKNVVLDSAYKALSACSCDKACTNCLIDRHSQWYINYLDRNKALEWLEMEQKTRTAPDSIRALYPEASVVTSDLQSELYQVLRDDNLKSVDFFIDSDVARWNPEGFLFIPQMESLRLRGVKSSFIIDRIPSVNDIDTENLTSFMSVIFRNRFAVGHLDTHQLQPLLLLTMNDGRRILYLGEHVSIKFDRTWGTGCIFSTVYNGEAVFESMDPTRIVREFSRNAGNAVFEFSIMDRHSTTSSLLETLTAQDNESWNKVYKALSGKRADILYADKYVRSPLGCYIVSSILAQIITKCNLTVNSLSFQLARLEPDRDRFSRIYDPLLENFTRDSERNEFLKECVYNQCGRTPSISQNNQQHFRSLVIMTDEYECSIRPDGGFSWGWKLEASSQGMELDELKEDLKQNIGLYNYAARNSGILYTVAIKKK